MVALYFLVSLGASIIGAICGIGGGVLIKPLLDATGTLSVAAISFMSGCTVLAMTGYSVTKAYVTKSAPLETRRAAPLAIGAAVGGIIGAELFKAVSRALGGGDGVGAVQAACLVLIMIGIIVYTLRSEHIRTHELQSAVLCGVAGLGLGILSSFLGIGGGPMNLIVLSFFFSMKTKEAASGSLYIVMFSQAFRLITTVVTGAVPPINWALLALMIAGGLLGGVIGRAIHRRIQAQTVRRLYLVVLVAILLINVYNVVQFVA